MSTTCWGSLFVTLGELPSNFTGCSSVLLHCFSYALGKTHHCSRKGLLPFLLLFPLLQRSLWRSVLLPVCHKPHLFCSTHPCSLLLPIIWPGSPSLWVAVSGQTLGWLWVDFRLILGLLMRTARYSKHKPHPSAGFPCRVQLRHWAWLFAPSPCVFLLTKRNFLGRALLPDSTFLSLVLAGWGQRQKEIFELTGVQSAAAAGMTSACICLL